MESEQVVMRIIMSDAQADAQFMCLLDRMAEKVAAVSGDISLDKITDGSVEVPGYKTEETELANMMLNIMNYSYKKQLRLGESILAVADVRAKSKL